MSQKGIVGKYDNDDIIYYNGSIVNSQLQSQTQSFVLANFVDSRTQPILDKADDYYMSVVRWSIPMSTVPLMIMQPLNYLPIPPFPSMIPNTDPNLIGFAVGLNYFNGSEYVDFNSYIQYEHQNNFDIPMLPITMQNESYYYIYSYQHLINMINEAYATCLANLISVYPAETGQLPPFFTYDPITNLYTLHCTDNYQAPAINPADPNNPNPNIRFGSRTAITIWMGLNMWDSVFIPGFNICFAGLKNFTIADPVTGFAYNKSIRLVVQNNTDLPNTGVTLIKSEFPVISNSVSFQNIVLTSQTLPIRNESINPTVFSNSQATSSSNNVIQIVSDYTYDTFASTQSITARLGIVYTPSVYRFTNLLSSSPLSTITIQAQYLDNVNILHPISLRSNSTFNFKLMFVKKSKMKDLANQGMKFEYM